ncbi:MAG: hypothetical protein AB7I41_01505 [Candidatus Sericytochromatia bacterium]
MGSELSSRPGTLPPKKKALRKSLPAVIDSANRAIALGAPPAQAPLGARHLARFHLRQAELCLKEGKTSEALKALKECLAQARSEGQTFVQELNENLIPLFLAIGHLESRENRYKAALEAYELAYGLAISATPIHPLWLAQVCLNRGLLYQCIDKPELGLADFNQAVMCLLSLQESSPEQISLLAQVYRNRGELQQSLQLTEAALTDFTQAIVSQNAFAQPPDLQELAESSRKLGLLHQHQGQHVEAVELFSQSIERYLELLAKGRQENRQNLVSTLLNRSQGFQALDMYAAAITDCDLALKLVEEGPYPQREALLIQARLATARGVLLWQDQNETLARVDFLAALYFYAALEQKSQLAFVLEQVRLHLNLARLWQDHNSDLERALTHYQQAIRGLNSPALTSETALLAQTFLERGNLLRESGEAQAAEQDYLAAFKQFKHLSPARRLPVIASMAQTVLQLGLMASEKGQSQEAHGYFDKAIQLLGPVKPQSHVEPSHIWVQCHYFRAFCRVLDLDQPRQAMADFEVIEAICPGYVCYDLACLNARLCHLDTALDYLDRHLDSPYRLADEEIKADPDLKPLKALKGWKALFKKR